MPAEVPSGVMMKIEKSRWEAFLQPSHEMDTTYLDVGKSASTSKLGLVGTEADPGKMSSQVSLGHPTEVLLDRISNGLPSARSSGTSCYETNLARMQATADRSSDQVEGK